MAYNARVASDALPSVRPRIIGGRLVTNVDFPGQFQGVSRSSDKINHHNPVEWEKQFQAALGAAQGKAAGVPKNTPETSPESQLVLELYNRLEREAKDTYLPRRSLELSEAQQVALIREIDRALYEQTDPQVLKQCYLELTKFDSGLTSAVRFSDLAFVLNKNQVYFPTSLLRLIAALFVVPEAGSESKVNYEKLISFLGACFRRLLDSRPAAPAERDVPPDDSWQREAWYAAVAAAAPQQQHTRSEAMAPEQMSQQPGSSTYRPSDFRVPQKPIYYEQSNTARMRDVQVERDVSRTKRLAEAYLEASGRVMQPEDFEALRIAFLRADRLVRGALSESHMKEICKQHGFPLPENMLEEIIRTCCTHRGGGQYDWEQFVGFLEKLQPVNTGLQISNNRHPAARRPPSPVASWPHAESPVPQDTEPRTPAQTLHEILLDLHDSKSADWLHRFEQFACALYQADEMHSGTLRAQELLMITKRYNASLHLCLPDMHVEDAVRLARLPDGHVDLHTFLKTLTRPDNKSFRLNSNPLRTSYR